ncbi:lysylphosphatidylglycerol synthase transmembrane domain-containing protein [Aquimarina litoralis]
MRQERKNLFYTFLKIGITLLLLYLVFTKIPFTEIWETLKSVNIFYLLIGIVCFILSQWISADRLLVLFISSSFYISPKSNYKLYLIGMFYNFFIPGGIGGDAYKVFLLHKSFKWSTKKLTASLFVDRFMGLTAIGILILIYALIIPIFEGTNMIAGIILLLVLGITASYIFIQRLFPAFLSDYLKTLVQSITIQLLQCICILSLLASITEVESYSLYIFVFLISSVLSIFSFSGIGVREMIFYQASSMLQFDTVTAVSIGVLFSAITALVSLFGIIFHFKKANSYLKLRDPLH